MRRMLRGGVISQQGIGPLLFLGIILAVMVAGLIFTTSTGRDRDAEVEVRSGVGRVSLDGLLHRTLGAGQVVLVQTRVVSSAHTSTRFAPATTRV